MRALVLAAVICASSVGQNIPDIPVLDGYNYQGETYLPDPDEPRTLSTTQELLFSAIEAGNIGDALDLMKGLSNKEVNDLRPDDQLESILHVAAKLGYSDLVESILDAGADSNSPNHDGSTSLHLATLMGHVEVMRILVAHGVEVNRENRYGSTALHYAANRNIIDGVTLLLENGADPTKTTNKGKSALDLALKRNLDDAVAAILQKAALPEKSGANKRRSKAKKRSQSARKAAEKDEELGVTFDLWQNRLKEYTTSVQPYPNGIFVGRGIATTMNENTTDTAYAMVNTIRTVLQSKLPIEIFYIGSNGLISPDTIQRLEATEDVRCIELDNDIPDLKRSLNGNDLIEAFVQPYAIMYSRFQEILWLQVNTLPLKDPEGLFESQKYTEAGALFWPDVCNRFTATAEAWPLFGLARPDNYPDTASMDTMWGNECVAGHREISGSQMLIDKSRGWSALNIAAVMSREHYFFYERVFGEVKQGLAFAYDYTDTQYHVVTHQPSGFGYVGSSNSPAAGGTRLCVVGLGHKDPDEGMAFIDFVEGHGRHLSWKKVADPEDNKPWLHHKTPTTHPKNMLKPKRLPDWCFSPSSLNLDDVEATAAQHNEIGSAYSDFLHSA